MHDYTAVSVGPEDVGRRTATNADVGKLGLAVALSASIATYSTTPSEHVTGESSSGESFRGGSFARRVDTARVTSGSRDSSAGVDAVAAKPRRGSTDVATIGPQRPSTPPGADHRAAIGGHRLIERGELHRSAHAAATAVASTGFKSFGADAIAEILADADDFDDNRQFVDAGGLAAAAPSSTGDNSTPWNIAQLQPRGTCAATATPSNFNPLSRHGEDCNPEEHRATAGNSRLPSATSTSIDTPGVPTKPSTAGPVAVDGAGAGPTRRLSAGSRRGSCGAASTVTTRTGGGRPFAYVDLPPDSACLIAFRSGEALLYSKSASRVEQVMEKLSEFHRAGRALYRCVNVVLSEKDAVAGARSLIEECEKVPSRSDGGVVWGTHTTLVNSH